jgi:hypothetical protein
MNTTLKFSTINIKTTATLDMDELSIIDASGSGFMNGTGFSKGNGASYAAQGGRNC